MATSKGFVEGRQTMRNLLTAAAVAATLAGGAGLPAFAQSPGGRGGQPQLGPGGTPAGSYQRSCRNEQVSGKYMTAECRAADGRWAFSRLPYTECRADIQINQIGIMMCGGIVADSGRYDDDGGGQRFEQGRNNFRDDRRDDRNDNRAGAAIAGAIAGALLGANGQPVPPPPAYGDPRYGDPRYDYRYQQGWWGYGHRPGEWVRIRDRADWLDRRIDRGLRDGRIDRRTARDLRRELRFIEDQEDRYLRDGRLGRRERADLDRRFDDLAQRIRFEARPRGRRDRY
jgi:hypothetical protein